MNISTFVIIEMLFVCWYVFKCKNRRRKYIIDTSPPVANGLVGAWVFDGGGIRYMQISNPQELSEFAFPPCQYQAGRNRETVVIKPAQVGFTEVSENVISDRIVDLGVKKKLSLDEVKKYMISVR